MRFHGGAASDAGARLPENDDVAFLGVDDELALAVLVDGMRGNLTTGRIPAELALEVTRAAFARRFAVLAETWWRGEHGELPLPTVDRPAIAGHVRHLFTTRRVETPGDAAVLADGLGDLVCTSLAAANEAISRRNQSPRHPYGIGGATVAAAIFAPGAVAIGHVGDVRVYRLRAGRLELLTREHTLATDHALAMPHLTEAELDELPRGVVTRALGMQETVKVDVARHAVELGDAWLLLSRGVFDTLDADRIAATVDEHGAGAGAILVEQARGEAMENVTAIVVTVGP